MGKKNLNICLFSGGSGNKDFIQILKKIPEINLNIIVNGYDDGKSTKQLRNFGKEILGPSDFRKNLINLINTDDENGKILFNIMNFRFPKKNSVKDFSSFLMLEKNNFFVKKLDLYNLSYDKLIKLKKLFSLFLIYYKKRKFLDIRDISLGNIIIFASFLNNKNSFNKSLIDTHSLLNIKKNHVFNVTNGENLFLYAILTDGKIIDSEEELVGNKHKFPIENIFLLPRKISLKYLTNANKKKKISFLNKMSKLPRVNPDVKEKLLKSDIIIYGPGTQYSSLFPSYLTLGLKEIINKSKAKKFLITNIFLDNDIVNEKVEDIIKKFYFFFYRNSPIKKNNKLVDHFLINKFDEDDINLLKKDNYLVYEKKKNFTLLDWEKSEGIHYPNRLAEKIFLNSGNRHMLKLLPKSVLSIIIPCLNERRTIGKVLSKIKKFKINKFDLVLDVIVVDGGSTDGSIKIIKKFKEFKFYQLNNAGKGQVIKYGIEKSKGDIIAFFPSDDEYKIDDLEKVVTPILIDESKAVYGSRRIKNTTLNYDLKRMYKNDKIGFLVSKYGGKLISLILQALHEISISDPFTSVKAFDSKILKSLSLNKKGFDLEFEILTKLKKKMFLF